MGDQAGKVVKPSPLVVSLPAPSMYLGCKAPDTTSLCCVGLIQVEVVPRPASTFSRPQLELPEILMKESEPLVPVVNTNLLLMAS